MRGAERGAYLKTFVMRSLVYLPFLTLAITNSASTCPPAVTPASLYTVLPSGRALAAASSFARIALGSSVVPASYMALAMMFMPM